MQNTTNKYFDRLALPHKMSYSISQNSEIVPDLFQLNHNFIIIKVLVALAQHFSKSSSFSTVCHKPVWHTNVLSVVVPSDNFHGLLMWLSQVDMHWNFLVFLCSQQPIFHHVYWICFETITYNVMIFFKSVNKVNYRFSFNKRPRRLLNFETVRCGAY